MDIALYEYDPRFVLERFREGEFDFVDAVSEVEETEFFRYIGAHKILSKLAETYPSPRRKKEGPQAPALDSQGAAGRAGGADPALPALPQGARALYRGACQDARHHR